MAKTAENSRVNLGASSGEGNIPWNGVKRGLVVSYTQVTKGAVVDAPKIFKTILKPRSPTTISVTRLISLIKNLGANIFVPIL